MEEVAWLIEIKDRPVPMWFSGMDYTLTLNGDSLRVSTWTDDSLEAVRFSRKVDADKVSKGLSVDCVSLEHMWLDNSKDNKGSSA